MAELSQTSPARLMLQAVRRVGGHHERPSIHRSQALAPQALSHSLGADDLAVLAQLVNDSRAAIALTAGVVDGGHLGVQSLVGQCARTGRAHAPLAVAAARHLQHAAQPADGVLVAMLVDP